MAKPRPPVPDRIAQQVLKEYNHRCASCGVAVPQLHHIDENPSNNDPQNLLPLCPNCHLIDQHNPTRFIQPDLLRLFRRYKDPFILKPQFLPLFARMRRFQDSVEAEGVTPEDAFGTILEVGRDLHRFVEALTMGSYYAGRLKSVTEFPSQQSSETPAIFYARYRSQAMGHLPETWDLIIELLRFQSWPAPPRPWEGR
jgi:hypothetical protein